MPRTMRVHSVGPLLEISVGASSVRGVGALLVDGLGLICSPHTTNLLVLSPGGSQVMSTAVACLPLVSLSTLTFVGGTISLANT